MITELKNAKAGDIILQHSLPYFNPLHTLTGLIHLICGNSVVHCGVVNFYDCNTGYIHWVETNPGGTKYRSMKVDSKKASNYSIQPLNYKKEVSSIDVWEVSDKYINYGYAYLGILNLLLNHTVGVFKQTYHTYKTYIHPSKDTMICSQLAATIVNELQGEQVFKEPNLVQPDDFINLKL